MSEEVVSAGAEAYPDPAGHTGAWNVPPRGQRGFCPPQSSVVGQALPSTLGRGYMGITFRVRWLIFRPGPFCEEGAS